MLFTNTFGSRNLRFIPVEGGSGLDDAVPNFVFDEKVHLNDLRTCFRTLQYTKSCRHVEIVAIRYIGVEATNVVVRFDAYGYG